MIKKSIVTVALVCSACAAPGDALPGDELLGEASQDVTSTNGISLNGISLNGISLNGISLNGISLNGISLNGTSLTGVTIKAGSTSGPPMSGASLVGSTWNGTAYNGTPIKLRIDTAIAGTAPNAELWFYGISYQTSAGWSPLCGTDLLTGNPVQAVSVAGVWNSTASDAAAYTASTTQFTLACRGRTIAKCVELGYKTYKGYTSQLTSCVRLLRGDYCGTGVPHTIDGTLLNLYDHAGVQADTQGWFAEAEWTPSGARCVNSHNAGRYAFAEAAEPKCVKRVQTESCGYSFVNGAVLIDELPLQYQTFGL
jgi:hypothetical protein